jgi:hypothetical protein
MSTIKFAGAVCLLLAVCAVPSYAVFEDVPPCAQAAGLGGAGSALEAAGCAARNPALLGSARKFSLNTGFNSSRRVPQGAARLEGYSLGAVFPRMSQGRLGTVGVAGSYRDDNGALTEKMMSFGMGTWQMANTNSGTLDLGANFKILQVKEVSSGESKAGAGVDLGALLRAGEGRTLGISILNVNNPSFGVGRLKARAPLSIHLGAAEKKDDYTLSFEVANRTASNYGPGNFSAASGVEHLWRTYRYGVFASRAGLFLADRSSALSLGAGFRRMASDISYSLSLPLTGAIGTAHFITFALRFGDRDIEPEYERLMRQEIKYRKDLVMALDESASREKRLRDQLADLKEEVDALADRLRSSEERKSEVKAAKDRLEAVIERQRAAERELKALEEKRKSDKLAALRYEFSADWQSYLRLKSGGAPAEALKGSLQRLIGQYQDSGIDISQATVELRNLVGE